METMTMTLAAERRILAYYEKLRKANSTNKQSGNKSDLLRIGKINNKPDKYVKG
jgi:hypothetical protein